MVALLLWVSVALGITPDQVPNPRPAGWVSDVANVIDADDEATINTRISALNRDLGVEIAVVTVPSVDQGTPKQFTTELFNTWGIGRKGADDGLLVVLAVEQRRLEMETGYGLEGTLPDGWLGVMQSQRMVPRFKEGDFGGGIVAGLDAVGPRLRNEPVPAISGGARPQQARDPERVVPVGVLIGGTLLLLILVCGGTYWVWRRNRTCPDCGIPMRPLPEDEEDAFLDDGQESEEALGAASWDVYQCPDCAHVRTFSRRALLSGFASCPRCAYRTKSSTQVTTSYPTRYSTGSATVTETCGHCSYHSTHTVVLARLPEPSSSSSSSSYSGGGGGGFSGGSSGGGGAGSSW